MRLAHAKIRTDLFLAKAAAGREALLRDRLELSPCISMLPGSRLPPLAIVLGSFVRLLVKRMHDQGAT